MFHGHLLVKISRSKPIADAACLWWVRVRVRVRVIYYLRGLFVEV